jgi:hypothetical protein
MVSLSYRVFKKSNIQEKKVQSWYQWEEVGKLRDVGYRVQSNSYAG